MFSVSFIISLLLVIFFSCGAACSLRKIMYEGEREEKSNRIFWAILWVSLLVIASISLMIHEIFD